MPNTKRTSDADAQQARRFALIGAGICALVSFLPYLYGVLLQPVGQTYLGYQYNTDDQMVYSAWMRQAQEGHFFFDNRFAVDAQPGLTVHIYFFLLGLFSKLTGIPLAAALAKAGLSWLFVILLYRLLSRLTQNNFLIKLGLSVAVLGGGVGFLVWHRFGEALVGIDSGPIPTLMLGRLPIDIWQPEAFVFSSMLTNSLFMAALCLILGFFLCVIDARESWRPVPIGFILLGLLMNIHSYDVLLVSMVLVAYLAASVASGTATWGWAARVAVMGLGAAGPALWFWRVFQQDQVFQARAETPTFSPNFRQVFLGLVVLAALGLIGLYRGLEDEPHRARLRRTAAIATGVALLAAFAFAGQAGDGFWLDRTGWGVAFAVAVLACACLSCSSPVWNLFLAWAVAGLVAIYFPALFQRKLSMGIAIPWAVLASVGLWHALSRVDRGMRNMVGAVAILVLSASSIRWFLREGEYIRDEVSRTTVHAVFLNDDVSRILRHLDTRTQRTVVLAMPGIPQPMVRDGGILLDRFEKPYLPDLNAIVSGLTGAYSYAGHWSETPDYLGRRNESTKFFLTSSTEEERRELIERVSVDFVIAPVPEAYLDFYERTGFQLADLTGLGNVVVEGSQFRLIQVERG